MSIRRWVVCLFVFSFPALWTHPLAAGWSTEGFQAVSAEELKMTSEPHAPGAPAIILYRQLDRDDNGKTSHEFNYFRIKILTEEGRKYADVEIPFSKDRQDVVNVHARTIRPDGSIAEFDGKVFEKNLVKGRNLRVLAKTFTLPDIQVGSIIEYFYTVDLSERFIYDSQWILSQDLFTRYATFELRPYQSKYQLFNLRWSWNYLPAEATPPRSDLDHVIRMEARNIPAFQKEDYMPPETELQSRVDFIYAEGSFESDVDKFWREVGKKRNAQLEAFIGKTGAMQAAVAQIVGPNDPPEMKLRKIYDRVLQIRNTSYEVSKTEQEQKRGNEKEIQNVEDLWKRGYGNGVQLTWLFVALARAAGFESYGCWVSSRNLYFFNPKQEQSQRLNANVALVKLNGKEMYFDPGAAFTPFGLLTWSETDVTGRKLDKDGGSWIRTPLPDSSLSTIERSANLHLSDTGDVEGKVTITFKGLEAMYRRLEERNADDVARKKSLEDEVKDEIPVASEEELTNHPDWASAETPLVAEFQVKIPGWASGAGKRSIVPAAIFTGNEKGIFEHTNRAHPIYVKYPFQKIDDITLEVPAGWQINSLPPAQSQNGNIVHYDLKVENTKGSLHLTRKLDVNFMLLEQQYYPALRNFFQAVRSGDEEQIVLQPAATAASN